MPLMTQLLLASPHQLDTHSRLFGPLQEKTSMDRNLIYWTRFLCYCLNVLHLNETKLFEKHRFRFVVGQRESLGKLWEHLQNAEWSEDVLEDELLEVSASFWIQRLQDNIRSIVADMTTDTEDLLWNILMFKEGEDIRFKIPLADIEDNLTHTQQGKSFVHSNGLAGKEVEMLEDLVNGQRRQQFLDKNGEWKWGSIRKHLKDIDKFKQLLLLLVHMTNIPSRGHKITGLRLVNGINRDRNGFVIDEIPLQDWWHGPWGSCRMSRAMAKWTLHYMGIEIPLQDWRHVAVAISRKLARDRGVKKADFENDDDDDDSEQYEIPDDLAASHTTKTAENYGVTIDILKHLTAESLEIFSQ
ncbi:hypothetical protein V490_00040, partial [Pseudogymnoascus sp. VKM F-3557]